MNANQSNYLPQTWQSRLYLCALGFLSVAGLGFTATGFFSFNVPEITILIVALIVSAIVNRHQIHIPKTNIYFTAADLITFWAIAWLGVPGGVLLAACSALASCLALSKRKTICPFRCLESTVATFAAANVFYLILTYGAGFSGRIAGASNIPAGWLAVAAGSMLIVHCGASLVFSSISERLDAYSPGPEVRPHSIAVSVAGSFAGLAGAVLVHFAFLNFGLAFGLFLLPVAVLADTTYRIYIRRLEQKTREISEASRVHLATVEALATAIDARDQVGIGHVRRTQIYAVGIGEMLGLSADELNALRTGALLHDIGKLAVPDHILNKPGRLTPAEMEKMKIHAAVGASILEKINFSSPVVPMVKHHHEAWDGSGYPDGLKREEIPLMARIIAVADAYDTLRGARPYRSTVSRDEARRALVSGAGVKFDPKLVDMFLRNLRQLDRAIVAEGLSYEFEEEDDDFNTSQSPNVGYVEQIKRANREVFTLYELARIFSSSLNLEQTLALFVDKVRELVPFDSCVIYLLDGTTATAKYAVGEYADVLKGRQIKSGEGVTGSVIKKRQSVFNISPMLDFTFFKHDFVRNYTAMASLPLVADEKLIGAISLYSCDLETYQDEHLRLLETVSRIAADTIQKSLQHAETESRALTDPMTSLPNARSLQLQFEKEAARARRSNTGFQLIMLDLDGFKLVNDTFGHKAGDMLLFEVGRVMQAQLRDYDFLARYAGDEFVAIVPEMTETDVDDLCRRIEKAVSEFKLPVEGGRSARVGVSCGAACFPEDGDTLDEIVIAADRRMYSVKASHRDTRHSNFPQMPADIVVELDESHIISAAIN
jgi:diguanylate cyclase (GGDEF)-like protein/putative nucleotidyltransferase with HDIG domain